MIASTVSGAEWRAFRELREVALQRFCRRGLEEIERVCRDDSRSYHERYISVYRWLETRDAEMGQAFDDPRRSTMLAQLAAMAALGVVEPEEMARFTPATRAAVELRCGAAEK